MTWDSYLSYFKSIVDKENIKPPYDDDEYYQYTKLNKSRTSRWLKQSPLTGVTTALIKKIQEKQHWIVITEPWCGDAAHTVPVLYLMSALNPNIHFSLQLRDEDSEIENYLTHGTKSIPVLIVRDANGNDLFHWGPRPKQAAELFELLKEKNASPEDMKLALQEFYNKDQGKSVQDEVAKALKELY